MYRRSLVASAVGFVGLVAISPVFATDSVRPLSPPSVMLFDSSTSSSTTPTTEMASPSSSSSSSTTMPSRRGSATSTSSSTTSTTTDSTARDPSTTTSSTAPRSDAKAPPSASQVCTPETRQDMAPPEGDSQAYEAGEAGSVEVERISQTEFSIGEVTPNDGWTYQITAPTGSRAKVKFNNSAGPPWVVRFAASMDQSGTEIHIRVTTCE